jgi:SAM-dependent methyltransferase
MTQRWREWWAKVRLVCSVRAVPAPSEKLLYPEFAEILRSLQPELSPYEGLAKIWDDYTRGRQMDYPAFLKAMARSRRLSLRSVLDLACGTGTLTARLAEVVPQVVGLDISPAMLAEARSRYSGMAGVQFVSGDFRGFQLGEEFDVAVCAFNSLNYVADLSELGAVFRSVAAHLRPAGLFVFDTVTETAMQHMSSRYRHVEIDGARFVIRFDYDPQARKETSVAALSHGVEIHRRIPLGPKEVRAAAQASGLEVDSWFSDIPVAGVSPTGPLCFFVLTRASSANRV